MLIYVYRHPFRPVYLGQSQPQSQRLSTCRRKAMLTLVGIVIFIIVSTTMKSNHGYAHELMNSKRRGLTSIWQTP